MYNESYSYNAATGNMAEMGGMDYTYGDTTHPHAVTQQGDDNSFGYDANGNMTSRTLGKMTSYTLGYDADRGAQRSIPGGKGRMTTVSGAATAAFVSDGDGKRVKTTIGTTTTAYVGDHFEWRGSTSTMVKYYQAGSLRVAMRTGTGNPNYLIADHLGSTSLTLSTSGTVVAELRYAPFGKTRYTSGVTPTIFHFTGQREDPGLGGLMFYNARWYDPALSRFAQADTLIPGPGNPMAWDRYAYAQNNALKYNDPSGHTSACAGGAYGYAGDEDCESYVPDTVIGTKVFGSLISFQGPSWTVL